MAFDVMKFVKEVEDVVAGGVPKPKLMISERAQIVMPYHVLFDVYEEESDIFFCSTSSEINVIFG